MNLINLHRQLISQILDTDDTQNQAIVNGIVAFPFESVLAVKMLSVNISCSRLDRNVQIHLHQSCFPRLPAYQSSQAYFSPLVCSFVSRFASLSISLVSFLVSLSTLGLYFANPSLTASHNQLISLAIANNPNSNTQQSALNIQPVIVSYPSSWIPCI
ncbi:hypothetical protein EDC96DRAFT_548539 [Choanephora cucurbitarum]|nr:hypothetical protein EDC96DRAFT_548539 [Choanephora cucurbitarum]